MIRNILLATAAVGLLALAPVAMASDEVRQVALCHEGCQIRTIDKQVWVPARFETVSRAEYLPARFVTRQIRLFDECGKQIGLRTENEKIAGTGIWVTRNEQRKVLGTGEFRTVQHKEVTCLVVTGEQP